MATRVPALVLSLALLPAASAAQGLVPFGPEFQVNSHATGVQMYSAPAILPDGSFVVIWGSSTNDGRGGGAFGQRYDSAGVPVGPEFRVNTNTGFGSFPDVVSDEQGGFTVVWVGPGEDVTDIFARRYDASGTPLDPVEFRVNTYTTGHQGEPSIARDAAGRTVIVWDGAGDLGGPPGVYGQRYDGDGQPQGGEFPVNTATTAPFHHATVAADAAGNFTVVWDDWNVLDIFARRYDSSGVPLGPPFQVNTSTLSQFDAFVAADSAGNFVVVWQSQQYQPPVPLQVGGRRFDASGTAQGGEFRVNTITTGSHLGPWPSVAFGPDGGFTMLWEWDEDGSGTDVLGRTYDSDGVPVGAEFRVSMNTTGNHGRPIATAAPGGDFLVTWTAFVGANSEIFARRYRTDLIFADGFESGSLSAWSASATGGGDLTVSSDAAAKLTANGLRGAVDDTAPLYVQDASPRDEPRYRARFHFDTNSFDPGEADSHLRTRIFIAFEEAPTRRLAAVVLRRQGGAYSLIGRARLDDGAQADTPPVPIADGPQFVEIDWRRASGPDANDGAFEMWVDGTSVAALSSLDNDLSAVDFVRLGALSVKSGASGTMYWDEFESRRGSYIGP
jgi:hypothetical protein